MTTRKHPMQADGKGSRKRAPDGVGQARKTGGESAGGPYPNPHRGKQPRDGLLSHGGQTEIGYHGTGQLGEQGTQERPNPNSPARKG